MVQIVDNDEMLEEEFDDRFGEEPDFEKLAGEDYVDIKDEDLMPDLLAARPKESDGMDSVVIVDGIPAANKDKLDKLKTVIRKLFKKCDKIVQNEHYPMSEAGETKGYCFLEFPNHADAVEAVKALHKTKLDKNHTLLVQLFSDFEKYENIPDEWEPPKPEPFKDTGSRKAHLLEPDACDQYAIVYKGGEEVAIHLNSVPDATEIKVRSRWTDSYVKWSPMGSYLATFHPRGIAVWGGQDFNQIAKFEHPGVQFIDFSPCENYMVTFSPPNNRHAATATGPDGEPTAISIWETRTGVKKRSFHADMPHVWPIFKWSHNDKFFARMSKDGALQIYETPSFRLLDNKSVKVKGMRDFSWSPSENILSYWVAEDENVPARVVLMQLPSRNEVRVKNLFSVADCKMHWQKSGDYLCVKVDRYSKLKREGNESKFTGLYCNFEVFHMKGKQIPVDSVEIKENVHAFAWEPVGHKFAIIHGDTQSLNVSFYGVKTGQTPTLLKKYERKSANHLFWSPTGQFVVLAGLRTMNGVFEFIDTSDFTTMSTNAEHFMCTDVEWDPTGRYVMTAVSWWGHKVDNAYWLWSFQGKILKRNQCDKFCQLLWRPRLPTLLPEKKLKEIKKNLKKYSVEFDKVDSIRGSAKTKELLIKRKKMYEEYMAYRKKKDAQYAEQKARRLELREGIDTDQNADVADNNDLEEEVVEFLIKEEKIPVD